MVAGPNGHGITTTQSRAEGLVAALVAMSTGNPAGVDKSSMFYAVPSPPSAQPPPPLPWIPEIF